MKTLLIAYHSMTGGTRQMVQAAAEGARRGGLGRGAPAARREAGPRDVLEADGYLFATPENLASMAGLMKDFFDRCYYPALDRINGRRMRRWSVPAATARTRCASSSASRPAGA